MKQKFQYIILVLFLGACSLQPAKTPPATDFTKPENKALLQTFVKTINDAQLGYIPFTLISPGNPADYTSLKKVPNNGSIIITGEIAHIYSLQKVNITDYRAIYRIKNLYAGFEYKQMEGTNSFGNDVEQFTWNQHTFFNSNFDEKSWTNIDALMPYAWPKDFTPDKFFYLLNY